MKIVSAALILITVYLSFKHGWGGVTMNMKPEETKMLSDIGIGKNLTLIIGVLSLSVCGLILFPQTFFIGNLINAGIVLFIMAMSLNAGVIKTALIEIPFLLIPLLLFWLGHPFKR